MEKKKFGDCSASVGDVEENVKPSDPIIVNAFNKIWKKIQKEIFIWEDFKTDLPFQLRQETTASDNRKQGLSDEQKRDLHNMCFDEKGKRKSLTRLQLSEIAETGQFTVKSLLEERFDNVWQLGSFLQLGRIEINRRLNLRRKQANKHWFLYLPECLSATNPLSLRQTFDNIKNSVEHVFRMLFGTVEFRPRYSDHTVENILKKNRLAFLFEQATALPDDETVWLNENQLKLNLCLAKPKIREHLTSIVEEVSTELDEKGAILDTDLLLAVTQHPKTALLDPELPELLSKFHDLYLQMSPQSQKFSHLVEQEYQKREEVLKQKYRFRGSYQSWRESKLREQSAEIFKKIQLQCAREAMLKLDAGQEKYLLDRNLTYSEDYESLKKSQLELKNRLAKTFKLPKINWSFKPLQAFEHLQVSRKHLATNRLFWRISYILVFAYYSIFNNCLKLIRAWLFSPLGSKSVLTMSSKKFQGEVWLSDDGFPIGSGEFDTYLTDISDRRKLIKKYRDDFEKKSDYGLFPRSVGRFFNRFYCYIMIGMIGSIVSIVYRYSAFILLTSVVLFALLLSPVWAVLYAFLSYSFSLLLFDFIGPQPYFDGRKCKPYSALAPLLTTLLYHLMIRGVLFLVISLLTIVFHALATPIRYLLSMMIYAFQSGWGLLMRLIFIYPFARVPGDNFPGLIQRVSGYGIAFDVLINLQPDEALLDYRNWLDLYALEHYEPLVLEQLNQYQEKLQEMMVPTYRSIVGDSIYPLEKQLYENIEPYQKLIDENLSNYRTILKNRQTKGQPSYVRLSREQLPDFLVSSEVLLNESLESFLLPYMSEGQITAFWQKLGIKKNEWNELNQLFLNQAFSRDIFTAFEDCDSSIELAQTNKHLIQNLLMEKEPSSKVSFNIVSNTESPKPVIDLAFKDNTMWSELYHYLYLPIDNQKHWNYLQFLRKRNNHC